MTTSRAHLAFLFLLDGAMVAGSGWFLVRYTIDLGHQLRPAPALDTPTLALVGLPPALALATLALGAYAAWGTARAWRGENSVRTRLATAIGAGFGGFVIAGIALAFAVGCVAGVIDIASALSQMSN